MTDTLLYNNRYQTKINNILKDNQYNPKKISDFINQFEEQRFDTVSEPVSMNDSHITISGVNSSLQRDLDFKNGYSLFQSNNTHYDIVNKNQFTHNNMIPNTSRRDFDVNTNDQRKLETFTGVHKYYTQKKEKVPLFEPMTDLTWVNGMPSITDKMQNRYLPSNKNNNGDLPFQNKLKIKPGLDDRAQEGRYSVYRVNPRNVDALRSEINQKTTYNNVPIESGKRANISGSVNPTLTKFKLPDFREQGFDTLMPGKYLNEGPKQTGSYTNVDSQRGEDQFMHFNPAVNRNQGDGPDKNKMLYQQAKKENYLNDPTHAVVSLYKPVLTNAQSYTNYETHRATTTHDKPGTAVSYNQGGNYILSNDFIIDTTIRDTTNIHPISNAVGEIKMGSVALTDKAKTTIRETTDNELLNKLRVLKPDAYTSYILPTDNAKPTGRQTLIDDVNNYNTSVVPQDYKTYTELMDKMRTTIREGTSHNDITGLQGISEKVGQVYLNDKAKTTIREGTSHNEITGLQGISEKVGQVYLNDKAKITLREGTEINNFTGALNSIHLNVGYTRDEYDIAKTTIRQTTELNNHQGYISTQINDGTYAPLQDDAKPTIRQTTLLQDYTGGANYVINNKKTSRDASENMTIDNRRQVLTYNRAPNGKGDMYGPYIDECNVRLNEPILFSYVPGPRKGSDYSVTPLQCRMNDANQNQRPTVDYSGYYINNNFINTLQNNPLVNNLVHQKNL